MKKQLFIITLFALLSCTDEPGVKSGFKPGKVYSQKEYDTIMKTVDPIPPGWCIVPGGGGYLLLRC